MKVGAVSPPARGDPFRQHFKNRIESLAREIAIRIGAGDQAEQIVFVPTLIILIWILWRERLTHETVSCRALLVRTGGGARPHMACGSARRHNLLRQHVQWRIRNHQAIQVSLADGPDQRPALDQFVPGGNKKSTLGNGSAPVAGTADSLQRNGDRAWRTDLDDQIHGADINSQFKRRCRDQHLDLAILQFIFCCEAELSRQAAVVSANLVVSQTLGQMM